MAAREVTRPTSLPLTNEVIRPPPPICHATQPDEDILGLLAYWRLAEPLEGISALQQARKEVGENRTETSKTGKTI